ncbi:MAG: 4-hydroxy-tetrahydrodipicolinate synthase [Bacteroidota bacterium]
MADLLFRGTAPALVTPFTPEGTLDEPALTRLIDAQIDGGVEALVLLGTTGENPTITPAERQRLTDVAVAHTAGRVPLIVGTGTNNTAESVRLSRDAADAGADALLIVGPYYNKPPADGLVAHVGAIAEAADLPIVFYNVPGRTGQNVAAEVTLRLAEEVQHVVGVKEASGNLAQIADVLAHRPEGFAVYAGDDELALPLIALGADGVVSVVVNALPEPFCRLVRLALDGETEAARALHFELLPAMRACFLTANPIPVKVALADLGLGGDTVRLPLVPPDAALRQRILAAFRPCFSDAGA